MTDQKREHVTSRECWCNPYYFSVGTKILTEYAGKIVRVDPVEHGMAIMHIERKQEPEA